MSKIREKKMLVSQPDLKISLDFRSPAVGAQLQSRCCTERSLLLIQVDWMNGSRDVKDRQKDGWRVGAGQAELYFFATLAQSQQSSDGE